MHEAGILSEIVLTTLTLMISVQSNSLWASLLTIPMSIMLVMGYSQDKASGLLFLLFVMIFIGGLLVLLVSVASSVNQEQGMAVSFFIIIGLVVFILFILFCSYTFDWSLAQTNLFSWIFYSSVFFFILNISILMLSLFTISFILMEFKGMIRKL